jgi:membrane protease YdiL (CAAX protease family)
MNPLLPIILCLVLLCWAWYLFFPQRRASFLRQEPFVLATWGLADLLISFFIYLGGTLGLLLVAQSIFHWNFLPAQATATPALVSAATSPVAATPSIAASSLIISNAVFTLTNVLAEERKLWIASAGTLLAVLLSGWLVVARTAGRVGWSLLFVARDIRLASLAAVLCLPLVFLVQAIVVQLPGMEYQHPFIRLLLSTPSPRLWLATAFAAIIVAPIAEEFFFRGLLQGWLERLLVTRHLAVAAGESILAAPLPSFLFCLPILLSSVAFSAVHFNHGGGWVAILVLALGLGLLYHKTHRLLPCILLHMALNATSLGLAYLSTRL